MSKRYLYYQFKNSNNKQNDQPIKIKQNKNNTKTPNLNNSFSKEFTNISEDLYEDDQNNLLAQSYSYSELNKYKEEFLKEPLNIILESYLYEKKTKKKKIKFITLKDISKFNNKLNNIIKNKKIEEYLEVRNIAYDDKKFNENLKDYLEENIVKKIYETICRVNYKLNIILPDNNVNPILTIEHLFEEIKSKRQILPYGHSEIDLNDKYNKLKPIIYRYRQIKGDGNCFYRAVMFRYIELLILKGNINILKKILMDMNQCFNSKIIQSRLYIKMNTYFKPILHMKIMALILNLVEKNKIKEAHEIFLKCVLSCSTFDYGLILYFRYIIYLYIKDNENKLFSNFFPIKIGNLLPSIYENQNGEFEFEKFYTNYLLKMFMEAEKIIVYLTPFVLGIYLDIIIFEDNEEQIIKTLSFNENNSENKDQNNIITLLNRNEHYELIYTKEDYEKFSNIYSNYEYLEPTNNFGESCDNDFFLLQTNRNKIKNKDNNISYDQNDSNDVQKKENDKKEKQEMKVKTLTETPMGHPEFQIDEKYLDNIDKMFSRKDDEKLDCFICQNKIKILSKDKYNICNKCLENEILFNLKNNYKDYLINIKNNKNKFKINQIKINKTNLSVKDILDIVAKNLNLKNEKELINYIKKFVCLKCLNIIDKKHNNNVVNFPCGCCICKKQEFENYFTEQNEISENYTCICGYKYESKDLYKLCEECNKIGCDSLILFIINIFNKSILTKGCSGCGKSEKTEKINYIPEKYSFCFENYLKERNINLNLDHSLCKECKKILENQQFLCFYCKRFHLYLPH